MSAGKGKRGADGPLAATSSSSGSSDEDSPRRPPVSFQESALEPQLEQDSVTAVFPIAVGVGKLLTKGGLMSTPRIGQIQHQDVRKPKLKKKRADLTVGDLEMTKATLQPATPRSRPPRGEKLKIMSMRKRYRATAVYLLTTLCLPLYQLIRL